MIKDLSLEERKSFYEKQLLLLPSQLQKYVTVEDCMDFYHKQYFPPRFYLHRVFTVAYRNWLDYLVSQEPDLNQPIQIANENGVVANPDYVDYQTLLDRVSCKPEVKKVLLDFEKNYEL